MIKAAKVVLGLGLVALAACGGNPETKRDTSTTGTIGISVDETFQPIIESQVSTFEGIYKYANINAQYKAEGKVFDDLINDSTRIAIVSRKMTDQEKEVFDQRKITPRYTRIAIDAVALIVNNKNQDTLLTMSELRDIFTGKITSWKQLNPESSLRDIAIVFDNNNSSTARYMRDTLMAGQPLPTTASASNSHPALIDYVAKNENAIGVIGVNWISDRDDTTSLNFLNQVKVVGVSAEDNPVTTDSYFQPYQAYIAQGEYPLRRFWYIISTEGRAGLGTGFASYVASDRGQRIILKSGLVPATMPVRIVGFNNRASKFRQD
ncbi:PstS family phosphate ABC transporter substrate-binding protein [uncultured Pontibacter sp.]|uniref:PstS family phosphate ABC transporter substrate-binding protein n=1 Tax=uncultured Pontibacter sp. TaxID=453356 RepID=UPI00261DF24D|nr:substrate-binding domain-containing protein [uncultured Pontibacter sp.]